MNTETKSALILGAGVLAGIAAGQWAAPRLAGAVGLTLGRWGTVVGTAIGGVLGAALASRMLQEAEPPEAE